MPTTIERMMAFHMDKRVLWKLTPPPILVHEVRNTRVGLTSGDVEFILWFGFIPARWLARHEPGPTPTSFVDRMIRGPVAYWEHQHVFREVEGGVELTDRITLAHKPGGFWGVFTRLFFDGLPLRILFTYRHWRTRREVTK